MWERVFLLSQYGIRVTHGGHTLRPAGVRLAVRHLDKTVADVVSSTIAEASPTQLSQMPDSARMPKQAPSSLPPLQFEHWEEVMKSRTMLASGGQGDDEMEEAGVVLPDFYRLVRERRSSVASPVPAVSLWEKRVVMAAP